MSGTSFVSIALENIRSLHNVGAIMRTCSFFGVKKVLLVGYTAREEGYNGKTYLHEKVEKTALGSHKDLEVSFIEDAEELVAHARMQGADLVCCEQDERSIDIGSFHLYKNTIIVFGNEVEGVSKTLLSAADMTIEIPRQGRHSSLNVATCCGIVLYHMTNKQ